MKATISLLIAILCTSACHGSAMAKVQWRTDDYRKPTWNELERAKAGCEVAAEVADDTGGAELFYWGYNYQRAYTRCMRSEGWLPNCSGPGGCPFGVN